MDDNLSIYQLNVQSADKLDERRDVTTRSYGGMCIVVTTAATAAIQPYPFVSLVLWAILIVVALAWLATLGSLTAKLSAKNNLLTQMEQNDLVPTRFLTDERRHWKALDKPRLQTTLKHLPKAFMILGALGLLGTLSYLARLFFCSSF